MDALYTAQKGGQMEIKRGTTEGKERRYILRSDSTSCWIDEEYINKKGKLVTHNITGYYPNFRMLAETGIPSHILRRADAKSMKALKEQMKKEEEKLAKMAYKAISNLVDDMDKPLR